MTGLTTRRAQRGAGALAVVLLLVFTASIALLHLQRGSLVAQRASVHQARAVVAAELAEAGVAWAAGMLNSPAHLGAGCRPDGTGSESFRHRYVEGPLRKAAAAGDVGAENVPLAVLQCRFVDADLAWAASTVLPAPGETASLPAAGQGLRCDCAEPGSEVPAVPAEEARWPAFVVTLSRPAPPAGEPADTTMADITVQVSSVGCPHGCSAESAATAAAAVQGQPTEGTAVARALLRHVNTLQWAPVASLTCAGDCQLEDSITLTNTAMPTAGTLAMAGGRILAAGTVGLQTLPGQPAPLALAAGNAALARLAAADPQCQASAVFSQFFGMSLERFLATNTETATVACTDAATCGAQLASAVRAGWRTLYLPDGLVLDETAPFQTLGRVGDGVRLIVGGQVRLRAPLALHGLVFLQSPATDALDLGPATLRGAAIGCGPLRLAGTGRITYAADAIGTEGASRWRHGAFVRLPGSWKDF